MATISSLTKQLIEQQPFLKSALAKGIINYQALAEELTPAIQKQLNKPIKTTTVMITLRRYAAKLHKKQQVTVMQGFVDLQQVQLLNLAQDQENNIPGAFFYFTHAQNTIACLPREQQEHSVLEPHQKTLITITSANQDTLPTVMLLFHQKNINPVQIYTTTNKIYLLFSDEQAIRAYQEISEVMHHA